MSEPLRIAFVVEGTTDFLVLNEIVRELLGGRDFEAVTLQPKGADALRAQPGGTGLGWPGVYRWCRQAAAQGGGEVSGNFLVMSYDVVIVQVDADVAASNYAAGHIHDADPDDDLPCAQPCPPPAATTDRLRAVMLHWLGEAAAGQPLVLCTPSKALESWVLAALFPEDRIVRSGSLECHDDPAAQLQGKPKACRLVVGGKKDVPKYETAAPKVAAHWADVRSACTEAERFYREFLARAAP